MSAYDSLEKHFEEIYSLNHALNILGWDEAVIMAKQGGAARANALATLEKLRHERLTLPEVGDWLADALTQPPADPWQAANLKLMYKTHKKATAIPSSLAYELKEASIRAEQAWRQYRQDNNWADFCPLLEHSFSLILRKAAHYADTLGVSPYDACLDDFSPHLTQATLDPLFQQLKTALPPLITQIQEHQARHAQPASLPPLSPDAQKAIGTTLMTHIGFDFERGRLDESHHPFCGGVPTDVRLTTRYNTDEALTGLMGICHETGHACYEQHLPDTWHHQPVGEALGMAVHESQSLIIEMEACRSQEFAHFLSPLLQEQTPHQQITATGLFHAMTEVKPTLIRVNANEVHYPLHVILRYELEKSLLNGDLRITDLPAAWDDAMTQTIGLSTKGNDRDGVMQDVHWPAGLFGYFPAYTVGRLIAAQLYHAALQAHPDIPQHIAQGDFTALMNWLTKHVHQQASLTSMNELLHNSTGEPLNADYFLQHIRSRYLND